MAHVTKGNVFRDLGFAREQAEDLAMRTYLMAELRKFIKKDKMKQARAAEFFGIPRPKISYIENGKRCKWLICLAPLFHRSGC